MLQEGCGPQFFGDGSHDAAKCGAPSIQNEHDALASFCHLGSLLLLERSRLGNSFTLGTAVMTCWIVLLDFQWNWPQPSFHQHC